jgi:tetratricopeptide (TPR) repeat protein
MLDCQLFGPDAGAHHLVSVGWHAANAALLLLLYYRLTGALWASAFGAALFAWHPLRVESVAWAAERKDVLSVFFFLLTLLSYLRYAGAAAPQWPAADAQAKAARKSETPPKPKATPAYILLLLCFVLGLMSKPMLVTTPFVLMLLDYWPLGRWDFSGRSTWKLVWEKMPLFLLSGACSMGTYLAQRAEAVVGLSSYPLKLRLVNTILSYGGYLWKTLWPVDLAIIYPFPNYLPWGHLIVSLVVLLGMTAGAWILRGSRPHLLVGWLWFLGTLVPVIGLVQVGSAALADRYTYIPHAGLFLALVVEVNHWTGRVRRNPAVAVLPSVTVLGFCLILTAHQLRFWQDGQTLFEHAIKVTGDNAMAQLNLALSLEVRGQREAALKKYEEALRLNPEIQQAHNAIGDLLSEAGRTNEALAHYQAELKLGEKAATHENLGALLLRMGRVDEALQHYETAAHLSPEDPRARYLIAKAFLRQGRTAEAVTRFNEALRLNPDEVQSLVYLARVLAADHDPHIRSGGTAVALAERANQLTGSEQSFILDTLAMAYAEAGRFPEAEQNEREALQRGEKVDDPASRAGMEDRLKLYQARQPYREDFSVRAPGGSR